MAQEQREHRLVTGAARVASQKTAAVIAVGVVIGLGAMIALLASTTGNAKEPAEAPVSPTAAAASPAPRPGIVIRPRHSP